MMALLLAACGGSGIWMEEFLPREKFRTTDMARLSDGRMILAGDGLGGIQVFRRDGIGRFTSVFKDEDGLRVDEVYQEPGGSLWMLAYHRMEEGLGHQLYRSDDLADSWEHVHRFEAPVVDLVVTRDGAVWARGGDDIYRSEDRGRSFVMLDTPWDDVRYGERMFVDGEDLVFASQTALHRTTDGVNWTTKKTDVHIQWMNDAYWAGRRNRRPVFAKRGEPFQEVSGSQGDVMMAASRGEEVWMLVNWSGGFATGSKLMVSYDGGRSWSKDSSVGTGMMNSGWHVESDGMLFASSMYRRNSIWVRRP